MTETAPKEAHKLYEEFSKLRVEVRESYQEELVLKERLEKILEKREKNRKAAALLENKCFLSMLDEALDSIVKNPTFDEHGIMTLGAWRYSRDFFFPSHDENKEFNGGYKSLDFDNLPLFKNHLLIPDSPAFFFFKKLRTMLSGLNFNPCENRDEIREWIEGGMVIESKKKLREDFDARIARFPYRFDMFNTIIDRDDYGNGNGHGPSIYDAVIWEQKFLVRKNKSA